MELHSAAGGTSEAGATSEAEMPEAEATSAVEATSGTKMTSGAGVSAIITAGVWASPCNSGFMIGLGSAVTVWINDSRSVRAEAHPAR